MLETLVVDDEEVDVHAHPNGVWYVDSPEFHEQGIEERIRKPPEDLFRKETEEPEHSLDEELGARASTLNHPVFTREAETHFFRLKNYDRFQIHQLMLLVDGKPQKLKYGDQDRLKERMQEASAVDDQIAKANIRLCAYWARRCQYPNERVVELFDELHTPLERCIRRFDYMMGNKFSTYASCAMLFHLSRLREYRERDAHQCENMEDPSQIIDKADSIEGLRVPIRSKLITLIELLPNTREQDILKDYYALNGSTDPLVLEQIGHKFGITKERARQLLHRAEERLRGIVQRKHIQAEDFQQRISWDTVTDE